MNLKYWFQGELRSKELFVSESPIMRTYYIQNLNKLVALLGQNDLAVFQLQTDPARDIFDLKIQEKQQIPAGFNKFRYKSSDSVAIFHKMWDVEFEQQRVRRTEVLRVNMRTGLRQARLAPYCDLNMQARFDDQLFIRSLEPNGFDVFPIDA